MDYQHQALVGRYQEIIAQALSSACSNGHVDIVKELLTSHKFIDFYIHCVLTDIFKIIHDVTDQDEFSNLLSCIKVCFMFYVLINI